VRQITVRFLRCSILCLAGYTGYIILNLDVVFGADTEAPPDTAAKVDHILLEVSNLDASARIPEPRLCDVAVRQRRDLPLERPMGLGKTSQKF
jgi:hypothetical protein